MTTREAIAITYAQAAKESGPIREALNLCAIIDELLDGIKPDETESEASL